MATKSRTMVPEAIAICAPLALLGAMHVLFTPPPAQPDPTGGAGLITISLPQAAAPKLSQEQVLATQWLRALPADATLESPMDHPVAAPIAAAPQPETEPVKVVESQPEPALPPANPLAGLKLTAVMGNDHGCLALISGKVYKAGDTVRPGVKLTAIEVKQNLVRLALEDGSTATMRRQQK